MESGRPRLRVVRTEEVERLEDRKHQLLDRLDPEHREKLRALFHLGERVELAGVQPKISTPEDWETMTGLAGALAAHRQKRRFDSWHGRGIAHVQLLIRNPSERVQRSPFATEETGFMVPIRFDLWHVKDLPAPLLVNPRFRHYFTGPKRDPDQAKAAIRVGHPDSRVQFYEEFKFAAVRCELPPRCAWWAARIAELDFFERVLDHDPLLREIDAVFWRHANVLGVARVARLYSKPIRQALLARHRVENPAKKPTQRRGPLSLVD